MNALIHSHSGLRWIVLILLIIAVFNSLSKLKSSNFTSVDKKINLFTLIFFHTQFLLGIILYFVSIKVQFFDGWMKDSFFRFYGMEHAVMMLIAFVLITMGYSKSKKAVTPQKKHKAIAVFYTISLILILAAIPWPFRALAGSWF